jgi:hypothetical protein
MEIYLPANAHAAEGIPPRSLLRAIVPLGALLAPDVTACQTAAVRTKADKTLAARRSQRAGFPNCSTGDFAGLPRRLDLGSHSGRKCGTGLRVHACGRSGSTVRGVLDFWVGRQRAAAG